MSANAVQFGTAVTGGADVHCATCASSAAALGADGPCAAVAYHRHACATLRDRGKRRGLFRTAGVASAWTDRIVQT